MNLAAVKLVLVGAAILAALLGFKAYRHKVWQEGFDAREVVAKEREMAAIKVNDRIQVELIAAAKEEKDRKDEQIRNINRRYGVAVSRLQQRSEQRREGDMPGSAGTCEGGTGAGLSRQDGEFLEGEAARANRLRAALNECYTLYDKVQAAQPKVE